MDIKGSSSDIEPVSFSRPCISQGLLEWLMGCGPAGPIMTVYQWKVQESSSSSVCKAGCFHWSSVHTGIPEIGSVVTEGTNLSAGAQVKSKSFLLPHPLYRWPPESVAQIKGGSSHLKSLRKNPSQVYPATLVVFTDFLQLCSCCFICVDLYFQRSKRIMLLKLLEKKSGQVYHRYQNHAKNNGKVCTLGRWPGKSQA